MAAEIMASDASRPEAGYPVSLNIARPGTQSRLTNFPLFVGMFIRFLLLLPHLFILYFFQIVMAIVYLVATFAILFTGRFPQGMFDIVAGYFRWLTNTQGYILHLYDQYPPFATAQQDYPLRVEVMYPEKSSRILNVPFFGLLIKLLLLIPHFVVAGLLGFVAFVIVFFATFGILFTGSFPEGMHRFVSGVLQWGFRLSAYLYALTDRYPPFSLNA